MSYQALARKWRPKSFSELVGQPHIVNALSHQLSTGTLHHAYLFTGTRGVGKTTIARLLAKSLNCINNGVSSNPCGECENCLDLDAGKFIDLIEVDAASRTGVDDTRELIESVSYLPAKGSYKVYLIDEVHMFSKSSFNALLKTLEEPPGHVKFVLATTDPEKLPITVLSRCLQFNLKRYSEQSVFNHLNYICVQESIEFEPIALSSLAKAGGGSMRDTLSLTDQALAFGQGKLSLAEVTMLLGTVHPSDIDEIIFSVLTRNGERLFSALQNMTDYEVDSELLLTEIMTRIRVLSWQSQGVKVNQTDFNSSLQLILPEYQSTLLQLWYDIGQKAQQLMPKNQDQFGLLEMTLLRMLVFTPATAFDPSKVSSGFQYQLVNEVKKDGDEIISTESDELTVGFVDVRSEIIKNTGEGESNSSVEFGSLLTEISETSLNSKKDDVEIVKPEENSLVTTFSSRQDVTDQDAFLNRGQSENVINNGFVADSLVNVEAEFIKNNDIVIEVDPTFIENGTAVTAKVPAAVSTALDAGSSAKPEWTVLVNELELNEFDSAIVESGELVWDDLCHATFNYPVLLDNDINIVKSKLIKSISDKLNRNVDIVFAAIDADFIQSSPLQLKIQVKKNRRKKIEEMFFSQTIVQDLIANLSAKLASDKITILEQEFD